MIYDGFPFKSKLNFPQMAEFLVAAPERSIPNSIDPAAFGAALAAALHRARPELDIYLLTDHAPERLALAPMRSTSAASSTTSKI